MQKIRFTKDGFEKLTAEYQGLLAERPDAVEHLRKARELGDLSENGYYKASRAKLSFIDSRLRKMQYQLKQAEIVDFTDTQTVDIGVTVTLTNEDKDVTYTIVGDLEADPLFHKLSLLSPIGKEIMGKKVGDQIFVTAPSGVKKYTISKIV